MAIPQLRWDVDFMRNNASLQHESYGVAANVKRIHYPTRLLRYWFMYHLLRAETARRGRPLSVCEIGVDMGQMLGFIHAAARPGSEPLEFAGWQAVDCLIRRELLESAGYCEFLEVDLERPDFRLEKPYDAAILLHVLEHLFRPEDVVARLVPHLTPGGIMIGGFPSVPHLVAARRERAIRPTARRRGHVSVFSPRRLREMAAKCGLEVEFLSGAFFVRRNGFVLENARWWLRFNLWFGARFPSWPGEIYWLLRKPNGTPEPAPSARKVDARSSLSGAHVKAIRG